MVAASRGESVGMSVIIETAVETETGIEMLETTKARMQKQTRKNTDRDLVPIVALLVPKAKREKSNYSKPSLYACAHIFLDNDMMTHSSLSH